ncbi:MAG: hypothetical protein VZS44_11435 [Bacilli bacterium]|nr:hypothetical protein [Bacilli bacterium]
MKKILILFLTLILLSGCASKTKEEKNENVVFEWKCTSDIRYEGREETKVLEVGKDIEPGNYLVKYDYHDFTDSQGQPTTNKFNRYYFLYISNIKVDDINGENINKLNDDVKDEKSFVPNKAIENIKEITLENGNYLYLYHTVNEKANYGDLTIEKK